MAFTKPTRVARFGGTASTETANSTEPPSGKKDTGWVVDEEPPSSFFNWLHYRAYKWFRWLDERFLDGSGSFDFTVKAPDVDASSDDGGVLRVEGSDSGADADKPGGNVVVQGGDATGDESSTVIVEAATAGVAGAGARVAEEYLRATGASGDVGRVATIKPLTATSPSGSAEPGVTGIAQGTGYGVRATGDFSAPARASLHVDTQNNDPSTPANGNVYAHSVTNQLSHYNSNLSRFQAVDSVVEQTLVNSSAIASTATPTQFNQIHPITLDTLRAGSVIKILAWGEYSITGTPTLAFGAAFGSAAVVVLAGSTRNANGKWVVDATVIVRTIGAGGTYSAKQDVNLSETPEESAPADVFTDVANGSVDTSANVVVGITCYWGAASASNTATMNGLLVEVQ